VVRLGCGNPLRIRAYAAATTTPAASPKWRSGPAVVRRGIFSPSSLTLDRLNTLPSIRTTKFRRIKPRGVCGSTGREGPASRLLTKAANSAWFKSRTGRVAKPLVLLTDPPLAASGPPPSRRALQTRAHRLRRPLHANELRRFSSLQTRAAALQTRVQPIASGTCATHLYLVLPSFEPCRKCGRFFCKLQTGRCWLRTPT